jgi:UDP-GlcNAc:undecaprenyl-phosphate GlcNAc-1-phosphate transferase
MIFYFSISIIFTFVLFNLFGRTYALTQPDLRKRHDNATPQFGGLVFGPLLILVGWLLGIVPDWYLIGGMVSILLGGVDDIRHIPWQLKLAIQLVIAAYIATIFWGYFDSIAFYNLSFSITPVALLIIFLIWFIGIYNAVNLLDGLNGLAGGFMFLVCISVTLTGNGVFAQLNLILAAFLLGFLVFNQNPSKMFMGDAGSLFLGFHIAVMPLLFTENIPFSSALNMTPFILMASFLVADTTRVFITRLSVNKNPMSPDTIHFHHLVLQESGSYLGTLAVIYSTTLVTVLFAAYNFFKPLTANFMIAHLVLLMLFILTPPVQTYVPLIRRAIKPLASWQNSNEVRTPFLPRTLFVVFLLLGLLTSIIIDSEFSCLLHWQNGLGILFMLIIIFFLRSDRMVIYIIQLGSIMVIAEAAWEIELGILPKLFSTMLIVSGIIFTLERRMGTVIGKFAVLDLLIVLVSIGGIVLSQLGFALSSWLFVCLTSSWFGISFIMRRTVFFNHVSAET